EMKRLKHIIKLLTSSKILINIGSGKDKYSAWFITDRKVVDVTKTEDWSKYLLVRKADNILAEHVWEHLEPADAAQANANCYQFLKKGGRFRIAVPDGFFPDQEYIDDVKPGGKGKGAHDHKILYTYLSLCEAL